MGTAPTRKDCPMNMTRAIEVLGINRTQWELKPMVKALGLMSYLNTPEETERRAAAQFVLRRWQAYQAECNKARDRRFAR
jgi:hypothetical protein